MFVTYGSSPSGRLVVVSQLVRNMSNCHKTLKFIIYCTAYESGRLFSLVLFVSFFFLILMLLQKIHQFMSLATYFTVLQTSRKGDFKTYIHSKCTKNQSILQILCVNLWLKTFYIQIHKLLLGWQKSIIFSMKTKEEKFHSKINSIDHSTLDYKHQSL